jgi:hypothetical protein
MAVRDMLGFSTGEGCMHHRAATRSKNFTFSLAVKSAESPCRVAAFGVNSEPHTGAHPSVRLCVGPISDRGERDLQNLCRAERSHVVKVSTVAIRGV